VKTWAMALRSLSAVAATWRAVRPTTDATSPASSVSGRDARVLMVSVPARAIGVGYANAAKDARTHAESSVDLAGGAGGR
jgi:hypothetical protein